MRWPSLIFRCRYIQADENCDGVLSFDEFKELIQNVEEASSAAGDSSAAAAAAADLRKHSADAQYTNRRVVRMYREAQESGGSSGAITRDGFIRICGKYGFIPFIDLDDEQTVGDIGSGGVSKASTE